MPGWNQGASWRVLILLAVGLGAAAITMIWTGNHFGSSVLTVLLVPLSFLAGYCYRQAVLNRGELPRLRALWLLEDSDLWEDRT